MRGPIARATVRKPLQAVPTIIEDNCYKEVRVFALNKVEGK